MTKLSKVDRQREHQANERTFLAWIRTSIALIGFGLAITRFGIFLKQLETSLASATSRAYPTITYETLGILLVSFGIAVIPLALWSYNRTSWQIERGDYQPNRTIIWITGIVVMLLGFLSLTLITQRESPSQNAAPKPRLQDVE